MFVPAARVQAIRESPSTQAAQRVRDLRAAGHTIVDLTVGEPDFDTPDHIKAAAVAAMDAGLTKYTPVNGIPALREAIAAKVLRRTGQAYGGNEIAVGGGAKQVIFLALMATIDPGDEVIVPAPYWVSYPDMVAGARRHAGGRPVRGGRRLPPHPAGARGGDHPAHPVARPQRAGQPDRHPLHAARAGRPRRGARPAPAGHGAVRRDLRRDHVHRPARHQPRRRRAPAAGADPARQRGLQDLRDDGLAARLGPRSPG